MPNILDLSARLSADVRPFVNSMASGAMASRTTFQNIAQAATMYLGSRGLLSTLNRANQAAMSFGQSLADASAISTLSVKEIGDALMSLDNVFGRVSRASSSMYRILSSGFSQLSASELVRFQKAVGISSKVIRADLYSTADVMTTIANAYQLNIKEIEKLQDWFYITVREGKARGEDLSRTLGLVVNSASEAGVSLNELGAAIAVLSRTQSVSQSMIGLNQMLNAFIKPTLQAQQAAKKWGIDISATALKEKGLTAILTELNQKVGGNVEALEAMFGNIRAGRAILSLTGKQFQNYLHTVDMYNHESGSGMEAFEKQIDTVQNAYERLQAQQEKTLIQIGDDWSEVRKAIYNVGEALLKVFSDSSPVARWGVYLTGINLAVKNIIGVIQNLRSSVDRVTGSVDRMASAFTRASASATAFNGIYAGARPDTMKYRKEIERQLHVLTGVGTGSNVLTHTLAETLNKTPYGTLPASKADVMAFINKNTLVRGVPEHELEAARIAREQIAKQYYLSRVETSPLGEVERYWSKHGSKDPAVPESVLIGPYTENVFKQREAWVKDSINRAELAKYYTWSANLNDKNSIANARRRVGDFYSYSKGMRLSSKATAEITVSAEQFNKLMAQQVKKVTAQTAKTISKLAGPSEVRDIIRSRSNIVPMATNINRGNNLWLDLARARNQRIANLQAQYNKLMSGMNMQNVQMWAKNTMKANAPFSEFLPLGTPPRHAFGPMHRMTNAEAANLMGGRAYDNPFTIINPKRIAAVKDPEAATFGIRLRNIRYNALNNIRNAYSGFSADMKTFARDTKNLVTSGWNTLRTKVGSFKPTIPSTFDGTSLARLLDAKSKKFSAQHEILPNPYKRGSFVRGMIEEGYKPTPSGTGALGKFKHWAARTYFTKQKQDPNAATFAGTLGDQLGKVFTYTAVAGLLASTTEIGYRIGKAISNALDFENSDFIKAIARLIARIEGRDYIDPDVATKRALQAEREDLGLRIQAISDRLKKSGIEPIKYMDDLADVNKMLAEEGKLTVDSIANLREKYNKLNDLYNKEMDATKALTDAQKNLKANSEEFGRAMRGEAFDATGKSAIYEALQQGMADERVRLAAGRIISKDLIKDVKKDKGNMLDISEDGGWMVIDTNNPLDRALIPESATLYDKNVVLQEVARQRRMAAVGKILDNQELIPTIHNIADTEDYISLYRDHKDLGIDMEDAKYISKLFRDNKIGREGREQMGRNSIQKSAYDFADTLVKDVNNAIDAITAIDNEVLFDELDIGETNSKLGVRLSKYKAAKSKEEKIQNTIETVRKTIDEGRNKYIEEGSRAFIAQAPNANPDAVRAKFTEAFDKGAMPAYRQLLELEGKKTTAAQSRIATGDKVYSDARKELDVSFENAFKDAFGVTNDPATALHGFNSIFNDWLSSIVQVAEETGRTAEEQRAIADEAYKDFLGMVMKDADKHIEDTTNALNTGVGKGTIAVEYAVDKQLDIYRYMYDYLADMLNSYEFPDEQRREIENAMNDYVNSYNKLIMDSWNDALQYDLTNALDSIEMDSLHKRINDRQAGTRKIEAYRQAIKKIDKRLEGINKDSELGRSLLKQRRDYEKEVIRAKDALLDATEQARENLMSVFSSVISSNMQGDRLSNYGLYHATNLLARLSPGLNIQQQGVSLSQVLANANARYSGSTPDTSRAMQQQQRLSTIMDSYIAAKQYQDAGIGKNVQTIVTIMGKRTPLFLN